MIKVEIVKGQDCHNYRTDPFIKEAGELISQLNDYFEKLR
jgi:hypothetical protein